MTNEKKFLALYNANSEKELVKIIESDGMLNDPNNWHPYGGSRGNFGTFENQQNASIPALIEKITNSTDACLLREAKINGIDPKSKQAPKSMTEAVERFYHIKDGDIGALSNVERRLIAENIQVIAVGDKQVPSIIIYDNGEGQSPSNFDNTFLSLHNSNKTNIHFVQGKYNMGSTGAVVFCGELKYQMIASKRAAILDDTDSNEFGFTLVRRHVLTPEEEEDYGKSTWYEYYAPGGEITSFPIRELDLGLYGRNFVSGSIVKLYSYELPRGSRSNLTFDLWRDLNQFLYDLPLPISLYEKRDYVLKNPSKIVLGNRIRITVDSRDSVKEVITFNLGNETILGNVKIEVIIFNHKVDHNEFIKNKSIIFTQNGQVHGFEGQSFISQELGFSLLKKTMLIHVNCTDISTSLRQDLFMANRTHLKNSHKTEMLRSEIINLLKKSEVLKSLNEQAKKTLLHDSGDDVDLLSNLLSKLPIDKDVLDLLKKNGSLNFLKQAGHKVSQGERNTETKVLNKFPAMFKLDLKKDNTLGKIYKTIPINSKGTVKINVDVDNEFLFRTKDTGKLEIQVMRKVNVSDVEPLTDESTNAADHASIGSDILNIDREGPNDGTIKLIITPNENAKVGDEVEVRAVLTSSGGKSFECIFDVRVDKEISKPKKVKNISTETFPHLPTPRKAYEYPIDENSLAWSSEDLNWTGHDIVKVITSTDEKSELMVAGIIVNMDSFVLKSFLSKNKINTESDIRYNKDKYFLSIYLHSLFLFSILQKMRNNDEKLQAIEVDDFVSLMIKPYANFLMYENFHITKMAFS